MYIMDILPVLNLRDFSEIHMRIKQLFFKKISVLLYYNWKTDFIIYLRKNKQTLRKDEY